jgi:hypothetical protein
MLWYCRSGQGEFNKFSTENLERVISDYQQKKKEEEEEAKRQQTLRKSTPTVQKEMNKKKSKQQEQDTLYDTLIDLKSPSQGNTLDLISPSPLASSLLIYDRHIDNNDAIADSQLDPAKRENVIKIMKNNGMFRNMSEIFTLSQQLLLVAEGRKVKFDDNGLPKWIGNRRPLPVNSKLLSNQDLIDSWSTIAQILEPASNWYHLVCQNSRYASASVPYFSKFFAEADTTSRHLLTSAIMKCKASPLISRTKLQALKNQISLQLDGQIPESCTIYQVVEWLIKLETQCGMYDDNLNVDKVEENIIQMCDSMLCAIFQSIKRLCPRFDFSTILMAFLAYLSVISVNSYRMSLLAQIVIWNSASADAKKQLRYMLGEVLSHLFFLPLCPSLLLSYNFILKWFPHAIVVF